MISNTAMHHEFRLQCYILLFILWCVNSFLLDLPVYDDEHVDIIP